MVVAQTCLIDGGRTRTHACPSAERAIRDYIRKCNRPYGAGEKFAFLSHSPLPIIMVVLLEMTRWNYNAILGAFELSKACSFFLSIG